jgi:histidine triad (HIT) family protein
MNRDPSCIFCRIVSGEAPAARLREDALTVSILDIRPVSEGHALVLTREHFENVYEATPDALAAVARASKRVAHALRDTLRPDGLSIVQSNGEAASQSIFHYHMHLIPRRAGSSWTLHGRRRVADAELEQLARRIAEHLPAAD